MRGPRFRTMAMAAVIGVATACASAAPARVPVVGPRIDVAQLAGRWTGEYAGGAGGRKGFIHFELVAQGDSALGEVRMTDEEGEEGRSSRPSPQVLGVLNIGFVVAEDGYVSGELQPYRDPATGQLLQTVFRGRLFGDFIAGMFTTRNPLTREQTWGLWQVQRWPATSAP